MAFAKQYYSSYKSNNNIDYYCEIWVDGYTGGNPSEISLGGGGPVISYETEDENRFSGVLSSQCMLPFMVKGVGTQAFIKLLRTTYQEKQVYLHLYRATSSTYTTTKPLWSGFLVMDLGAGEDVSFPYVQNLTFIDGLALLKDIDFVQFPAGSPPTTPTDPNPIPYEDRTPGNYAPQNMYWGPAPFTYWIKELLLKIGCATTTQGASIDYGFTTAINWYNGTMTSTSQSSDPLALTEVLASMFHTKEENGVFIPENSYKVLQEIMKHWGARITYWKHEFWIVQIPEYIEDETGFIDNPNNINSRQYNKSGTYLGSQDHLGDTYYTRYEQTIGQDQISKITGTKYNYLPIIKRVKANFLSLNSENFYGGFPYGSDPTTGAPSREIFQGSILDPSSSDFLWLSIPLNWVWDMSNSALTNGHVGGWWLSLKFNFYCTQQDSGGNITTYYLQYDSSNGSYYWVLQADWTPLGNEAPKYIVKSRSLTETDYIGFQEELEFKDGSGNNLTLNGLWDFYLDMDDFGSSQSNPGSFYCRFSGYTSSKIQYKPNTPNYTMPDPLNPGTLTNSGKVSWTNSLQDNSLANQPQIQTQLFPSGYNTGGSNMDVQLQFVSPLKGFLQVLSITQNSSFGFSNDTTVDDSTNSEAFSFGNLLWGDTILSTSRGVLRVWNGLIFVKTDPTGKWGRGVLTGTLTSTQILINEFISGQTKVIISPTMRLVVGVENKNQTSTASGGGSAIRPRYVNPIGRLRESRQNEPDPEYFFRQGSFHSLYDEWDYEGFEIIRETPTTTIVTNELGGLGGAQDNNPIASAKMIGSVTDSLSINSSLASIRTTVPSIGSNVAVNGNFNVATGWTVGTGWSIDTTNKKASFTATGSVSDLTQSVLTQGLTYQINFTVVVTAGSLLVKAGSSGTTETITASGDYSIYLDCEGSNLIKFQAGTTFTGSITYITMADQKSLSSLPINAIGTAVFKTNDTFNLINSNSGEVIPLTVTSNQGSTDTTVSVTSVPLYDDIGEDSVILINQDDLSEQYQNKTKGTVAGFGIDADGISKGGIEITGWLNSDTMTGAAITNVPTALSVKNYVDGQAGHDETLQQVTDNGNTTTNSIVIGSGTNSAPGLSFDSDSNTGVYRASENIVGLSGGGIGLTWDGIHLTTSAGGSFYLEKSGSASSPTYAFQSYTTTGMFRPTGLNAVGFSTNGSEKMRLTSGGSLLLGGTSENAKLTVRADSGYAFRTENASGNTFRIESSSGNIYTTGNLYVQDNNKIRIGDSSDLQIYHDGNNSYINDTGDGDLFIKGGNDIIFQDAVGNLLANMNQSNSVELYFGGSKKFETTNTGISITGGGVFTGDVTLNTGSHLFFDGGNSGTYIVEDIADRLRIFVGATEFARFTESSSDTIIFFKDTTLSGSLTGITATFTGLVSGITPTVDANLTTKGYVDTQVATIPKGLSYQGTWNASTNTPTIVSSVGTAGYYWIVSVEGTTTIDGVSDWKVGDWIIFSDSGVYQKIDQSEGDTLQTVTTRGSTTTTGATFGAAVNINGGNSGQLNITSGNVAWDASIDLDTGDTNGQWRIRAEGSDETFQISNIDQGGISAFSIHPTTKATTFGGDVGAGTITTSTGNIKGSSHLFINAPSSYLNLRSTLSDIYYDGVNHYFRSNSGSEKMRLTSGGNLLINTTTDDGSSKLQINGITSSNAFRTFTGNTDYNLIARNSSNTALYAQQAGSGNIFDVRYGSDLAGQGTSALLVNNSGNTTLSGSLTGTTATFSGQITIPATPVASTDAASKSYVDAQVATSDTLQEVTDNGNITDNSILIKNNGNANLSLSKTDNDQKLELIGGNGGVQMIKSSYDLAFYKGGTEKMRLNSTGLGIGTSSPASILHLKDSVSPPELRFEDASGGTQTAKIIFDQAGQNSLVLSTQYQSSSDGNLIQFAPADSVAMTILGGTGSSNGNVGINTVSPDTKMEIFEGYLKIGDSSNTGYGITLERNSATVGNINTANNRINIQAQNNRDVELRDTNGNGLLVKHGGNILINTTTDNGNKLQVSGIVNVSDGVYMRGANSAAYNGDGTYILDVGKMVNDKSIRTAGNVLLGGTLTGTTATFSQVYPKINLTDTTGVARTFSVGTNNETFTVRNETASSDAFTIYNDNKVRVSKYTVASQGDQATFGALSSFANSDADNIFLGLKNGTYPNRGYAFRTVAVGVNSDFTIFEHGQGSGEVFRIKASGSILIGTTTEREKLTVQGNIQAQDGGVLAGIGAGKDGFVFHDLYTGSDYWGYQARQGGIGSRLALCTNGAEQLTIDGNGSAIFSGDVSISSTMPKLTFTDLQQDDWRLMNDNGDFRFTNIDGTGHAIIINTNNNITFAGALTGTTATFSGLVSGITPTADSNFATKGYVDTQVATSDTLQEVTTVGSNTTNAVVIGSSSNASANNNYGTPTFSVERDSYVASQIMAHHNTSGNYAFLGLGKSKGTQASPTIVENGEILAAINFYGYDGANYRTAAGIKVLVGGTPGASDMPGIMTFGTTSDGSSAYAERMRLTSGGNVLIGTSVDYGKKLYVNGSAQIFGPVTVDSFVSTNTAQLQGAVLLSGSTTVLNKAQTTYIPLFTKNTTGSEVAYDLTNVGTATFSGLVSGITPTADANFATKSYVDSQVATSDTLQEVTDNGATTTNNITIGSTYNTLYKNDGFIFTDNQDYNIKSGSTKILDLHFNEVKFYIGNTEKLRLDSTGLGIGTTAPTTKLDVVGGGPSTTFRLSNSTSDNTTKYGAILGRHYSNSEEDVAGMLITSSSNTTAQSVIIGGGISGVNSVNIVAFYTGANSTTLVGSERARITPGGNLLLGTTTDVSGVKQRILGGSLQISQNDTAYSGGYYTEIKSGYNANPFEVISKYGTLIKAEEYGKAIALYSGDTTVERMRITSGGNLLLGTTTNYGSKLNVDGSGRFTGTAFLEGEVKIGTTSGANLNFLRTTANYLSATNATGYLVFRTGGYDTALTLDASQNAAFAGSLTGTTATFTQIELSDNQPIYLGTGGVMKIFNDGANSILRSQGEPLNIDANGINFRGYSPYNNLMTLTSGGSLLLGTTTDSGSKLYVNGIIRTTGGGIQAPYTHGFNIADSGGGNRYGLKFGSAGSVGDVNLMMLTNRSYRDATGGGQVAIAGNSNTTGVTEVEITRFDARASTAAGGVQSKVSMDSVLELTAQETPADPATGKSVIWMTTAGDLKTKINVGGTTVTRTIVTYEE